MENIAIGLLHIIVSWDPVKGSIDNTFWLLNVSTTLSAPSFVSKISSAMTLGRSAIIRQLKTTPPTGVIALSMSAAVVPTARFFAMTVYGPARPRMENPEVGFAALTMLNWLLRFGDEAEPFSAAWIRSLRARGGLGPRGTWGPLAAEGLFKA
jgi:hypothetical protein